jgi:hypothetical protein
MGDDRLTLGMADRRRSAPAHQSSPSLPRHSHFEAGQNKLRQTDQQHNDAAAHTCRHSALEVGTASGGQWADLAESTSLPT